MQRAKDFNPDDETPSPAKKKQRFGSIMKFHSKIRSFDAQKFVATYLPYVCLWMIRVISIVYSYAYHGYPALCILTWVLVSFITPAVSFTSCTVNIYLPLFTAAFIFTYFINIPTLFDLTPDGAYFANETIYTFGRHFKWPVIEICGMLLNIIFMILLISCKHELKLQRDEFKVGIFEKLTDKKSVFLW